MSRSELIGKAVTGLFPLFLEWLRLLFQKDDEAEKKLKVKAYRKGKRLGVDKLFDERDAQGKD